MSEDLRGHLERTLSGTYSFERELGGGGMSRVFVAEETSLGRKVVVKVLPHDLAATVNVERFRREIQLAAQLQHPHIVPLLSAGIADGLPYYTMPLVEGESLRSRVAKRGELPIADVVHIVRDISSALAYAHEHGVVHRDIKPDNILLTKHHALVTDFGVAKALASSTNPGSSLTSLGVALGTPAYMAPEQAAADPMTDHRADIYALGALAYEMLTGRQVFSDRSPQAMLRAHAVEEAEPVGTRRPSVPPPLSALVMRMLEKHPADRPQSAEEVLAAVSELATPSGGMAPTIAAPGVRRSVTMRHVPRPLLIAAVTAMFVIGAGVLVVRARNERARSGESVFGRFSTAQPLRLAVLPFENLGRTEDEHFTDGVTEEITARLAGVPGLAVISRTSTMQYKGSKKSIKQIAKELDIGYVLEGSIRWQRTSEQSARIRVIPQLIRVSDDTHLWASVYDETMTAADIFSVQSQIASEVVRALGLALREPPPAQQRPPTSNLQAYEYFLRARADYNRSQAEPNQRSAIQLLERAVQLDPTFADAFAELGRMHASLYWYHFDRTAIRLAKSKAAIDQALRLRPSLAAAHSALGYYFYWGFLDYDSALREFNLALAQTPADADVLSGIAYVRRRQGKMDDALRRLVEASRLDPKSANLAVNVAESYLLVRDYSAAERFIDSAIALSPDWYEPYSMKAIVYLNRGDLDRARILSDSAAAHFSSRDPETPLPVWIELYARNYDAALARLASIPDGHVFQNQFVFVPKAQLMGMVLALMNRSAEARGAYERAIREVRERLAADSADARAYGALGIAHAALGHRDEAIRYGARAIALLPVQKEAWRGLYRIEEMAHIYALLGDKDRAIDQLSILINRPSHVSRALLRMDPRWDSLRNHPRFVRLTQ